MAQGTLRKLGVLVALATVFAAGCSKSAADYVKSGDAFAKDGKHREALIEFRNAVQKEATNGEARLKLAETHEKLGEIPQAFREYIRAADLLQKDPAVQIKAGTYLLLAGRNDDAKVRAERALADRPQERRGAVAARQRVCRPEGPRQRGQADRGGDRARRRPAIAGTRAWG